MSREECNYCVKRKTIYCPNSSECYSLDNLPHFRTEQDLLRENKQLKEVIEKVKTEISSLMSKYFYEKDFCIEDIHLDKLLQILDKVKGE